MRLLHLLLLLPCLCGVVRSQLDFFVNSGEEEEESTQAPFLTLDVEVQEEVGSGVKEEVEVGPNGDLHVDEVPNGDNLEGEEQGAGENAASEEPAVEESPRTVDSEDGEVVNPNTEEETSSLLPVFGYIDPSELMGEQKLSELFDTDKQEKEEETPVEEDVGSPVQLTSEWEVPEKAINAMVVDEETA